MSDPTHAAPTKPAISGALAVILGVVLLVAAIVGIVVVSYVDPAGASGTDALILTAAVPAVGTLFLAAKLTYVGETHTAQLTSVQTALNGTLDARIKQAVITAVAELGAALIPAQRSNAPAVAVPIPVSPVVLVPAAPVETTAANPPVDPPVIPAPPAPAPPLM